MKKPTLFWVILAVAALGGVALAGTAFLFVLGRPMANDAIERAEASACAARLSSKTLRPISTSAS